MAVESIRIRPLSTIKKVFEAPVLVIKLAAADGRNEAIFGEIAALTKRSLRGKSNPDL